LSSFSIPRTVSTLVEKIFDLGECFVVKVTKNNKAIGDFTLIYPKGETIRNNELLLLFANQVALYLDRDKTDKALRINEEKYRYLFANNPQPMYIYDLETLGFLEVNQAAIDHYGYSKEEFRGMTLKDIRPAEDIPALLIDVENKNEKFKPAGVWRHAKKNGEIIFVDISTVSVIINGMNARHVLIQDITERKHAEDALRESEDKYRTMIENSNDMIWTLDKQGNFTFLNKIALQTTGLLQEECIGKSLTSFITNEDLPILSDIFDRTMNGEVCTYELRFKKTNEEILTILVNTSPINISGQIEGIVSFGRDITKSKESLQLLLESEEKFRSITEQTGDLISITNTNGILLYASTASKSIFQYEPEEMYGHNFTDFLQEESIPKAIAAFKITVETGLDVKNLELNMKRKDGSIFYGELNGSRFKNGDNNGTLVVIRDMSERKKVQEDLEEKMNDLIRFQNLTVDRELTMIELKKEVNELLTGSGQKGKYKIVK
jgi:PAS domain S-box-containing protein